MEILEGFSITEGFCGCPVKATMKGGEKNGIN